MAVAAGCGYSYDLKGGLAHEGPADEGLSVDLLLILALVLGSNQGERISREGTGAQGKGNEEGRQR